MSHYQMDRSLPPLFKRGLPAFAKFVLCLFASLLMLVFDSHFKTLEQVREVVATALYPLEKVAVVPRNAAQEVTRRLSSYGELRRDYEMLRIQAIELKQKSLRSDQLEAENIRLRTLLGLQQPDLPKMIAAEILYEARDPASRKVIIGTGSQQGIRASLPVMDERGLIGQVTRVFPLQAEVTLLTDKELSVPVQILRSGLRALVSGAAKRGYLELRFVAAGADLRVGDVLVTSGLDGVYPAGLPVATLVEVGHKANTSFASVLCLPIARLNDYRHVMVLDYDAKLLPPPPEIQNPSLRDRKGRLLSPPRPS